MEEIKEYHFHVYWFVNDPKTQKLAFELRDKILELNNQKYFVAIPLETVNHEPRGPHPIASYEVWVPWEYFAKAYSFFLLNRKELNILLHPLTQLEKRDHTERAVFIGENVPLNIDVLSEFLEKVPAQYVHLGLGYSNRINN